MRKIKYAEAVTIPPAAMVTHDRPVGDAMMVSRSARRQVRLWLHGNFVERLEISESSVLRPPVVGLKWSGWSKPPQVSLHQQGGTTTVS